MDEKKYNISDEVKEIFYLIKEVQKENLYGGSVTFSQFKNKTHYLGPCILEKVIF